MKNKGNCMKSHSLKLAPIIFILLSMTVSAEEPIHRFKVVVDHMVKAINEQDYPRIQKDFGKIMLEAFPLNTDFYEYLNRHLAT